MWVTEKHVKVSALEYFSIFFCSKKTLIAANGKQVYTWLNTIHNARDKGERMKKEKRKNYNNFGSRAEKE